ncbi:MAG: AI-2E family transporter [Thermoanaerobaculia bacterium]
MESHPEQDPTPAEVRPAPRPRVLALVVFALFAAVVVAAAWRILAPYLTPILLGAILATFTYRIYQRLVEKMKGRRNGAAAIMLLGITLVLAIPAFLLTLLLIQQATNLFRIIQETDVKSVLASLHLHERVAMIQHFIPGFQPETIDPDEIIVGLVRRIPAMVASHGAEFIGGFANVVLGFILTLLSCYYFYVEGEGLVGELIYLSPLPDQYDREIFEQFKGVVDATFRGQVLTSIAQGAVTAIGLAIAHIPGALFWGAVASVFSLLPMVGAAAVWLPAAAYLLISASIRGGGYGYGIFLLLWGFAVVSMVDNVIRPWAMRGGTRMPAILLFFSILGGIQAFGLVGLVLGPLVFALLVTTIQIYKSLFGRTLAEQNRPVTNPGG